MTKTSVEYADEQITVYPKCPYGCEYCYRKSTPLWDYRIGVGFKDDAGHPFREAMKLQRSRKQKVVVISFTTDPYPPEEAWTLRMRRVLEILMPLAPFQHIMVLTKSCMAKRDFDLMGNMWLGSTLTSIGRIPDEPFSDPNDKRIEMLREAHERAIKTWASVEPWIPRVTDPVAIIKETQEFVDWYVIGRLNHAKSLGYEIPEGYYSERLPTVIALLRELGKPFLIKEELREELNQNG